MLLEADTVERFARIHDERDHGNEEQVAFENLVSKGVRELAEPRRVVNDGPDVERHGGNTEPRLRDPEPPAEPREALIIFTVFFLAELPSHLNHGVSEPHAGDAPSGDPGRFPRQDNGEQPEERQLNGIEQADDGRAAQGLAPGRGEG
ncbi:hypothetical protein PG990_011585 [Apiospora arundinis]